MTYFEASLLVIIILITLSIVWGTLKTGISPMMSSLQARNAMLNCAQQALSNPEFLQSSVLATNTDKNTIVDIGSGWGTLVITAAQHFPDRHIIGYELSTLPWLVSVLRKNLLRLENLSIYRKNAYEADLSQASLILCYLYPKAMAKLQEKLIQDGIQHTLIISNTFALPHHPPQDTIKLKDVYQTPIYIYHWGKQPPKHNSSSVSELASHLQT